MGLNIEYIEGQTPIDEDERDGLIIKTLSTLEELNEFEQNNIEKAIEWTLKNRFKKERILSVEFIRLLHKKMFGEVWKWAGTFRVSNKNIGVDKFQILVELKKLLKDCIYWIDHKTYSEDEIAIRFKHRLVKIHLFANGNGRHARLCADILISHVFRKSVFSWNRFELREKDKSRKKYLIAIYEADKGNMDPLIEFARS